MRDTQYILRKALNDILAGAVFYNGNAVTFNDENKRQSVTDNLYVLYSTQQSSKEQENDSTWITRDTIDLVITHKQGFSVTKDIIDDISNQILAIVMPTRSNDALPTQDLFQILEFGLQGSITRSTQITPTETIVYKILTFSCLIIQQIP